MSQQQLQELKTHLAVAKQSPQDKIDQDFYLFMIKAKDALGESNYQMAQFYYQYANYILKKFQANIDIFNEGALPNNTGEAQEQILQNVAEEYQSSSQYQNGEAEAEVESNKEQNPEANEPNNQPEIIQGNEGQAPPEANSGNQQKEEDDDADDKDICFLNLNMAQKLYEQELEKIKSGESNTDMNEVLDGLKRVLTRTGDLCMMEEDYDRCIDLYQQVIARESERDGFESNQFISNLYLLIGSSYLNQSCQDCQIKAIREFIKAVNVLLSKLSLTLGYDISKFDIPTEQKTKVDRFHYMCHPNDSEQIKDIKEIISCFLDKIQDTQSQLETKDSYLAEKQKITQNNNNKNEFKPVSEETKVVHLGSFGNRKKKVEEAQATLIPPENYSALQESKLSNSDNKESNNTAPKGQGEA